MSAQTTASLDATDRAILRLLQTEARLGVTEIGRRVNLSQPAVSARIKRLEQSGVITGYRAVVDPAALGLNLHAVIRLRTTHTHLTTALAHFAEVPEITTVYRLTGEDCFFIDVFAANSERIEQIVDTIARYGPVTTSLVLRTYETKPVSPRPDTPNPL